MEKKETKKEVKKEKKPKVSVKAKNKEAEITTQPVEKENEFKEENTPATETVAVVTMEGLIKPLENQVAAEIPAEIIEKIQAENETVKETKVESTPESPATEEIVEATEPPHAEEKNKLDKEKIKTLNRLRGYIWNGQTYDF